MSIVNRVLGIEVEPPRQRGPFRVYAIPRSIPEQGEPDDRIVLDGIEADWFDETPFEENGTPELDRFLGARFFTIKIGRKTWNRLQPAAVGVSNYSRESWRQIRFLSSWKWSAHPADARIYEDSERPPWNLRADRIDPPGEEALRRLGSVFRLPEQWQTDATRELKRFESLQDPFVVAYDVGQGSANGIHAREGWVEAYFDFGGGTTSHAKTFPLDLRFCFTRRPLIVLSHWHADHWISASKHDLRALESDWIVPEQSIGPAALALALAIQHRGGRVVVIPQGRGLMTAGPISLGSCSGTSLNESGLAMLVKTANGDVLLPGDCGYEHLPDFWDGSFGAPRMLGLVAPHHGGMTTTQRTKPTPVPLGELSRLAYSFGKPNRHKHARPDVEAAHVDAGWTPAMTKRTPTLRGSQGHVLLTHSSSMPLPCRTTCTQVRCTLDPAQ